VQDRAIHNRVELKIFLIERSVRVRVPPPACQVSLHSGRFITRAQKDVKSKMQLWTAGLWLNFGCSVEMRHWYSLKKAVE